MKPSLPTINDVKVIKQRGPWQTKSGGELSVVMALGYDEFLSFFSYDETELSKVDTDIRGIRMYKVTNIKKGSIGANEWHRIRNEFTFVTKGSVSWTLQDSTGETVEYKLDASAGGLVIPHHIMHTYQSLENNTELMVLANTLFAPDNPSTHDTYAPDTFGHDMP